MAADVPVLSVKDLKKKIKDKLIIKGISFDVMTGEVFGFLGPNGSGKTTTIRMLVDLIKPTEGTVEINGISVQKHPETALRYVGCIVENPELYGYLTGWENLEHFARMFPDVTKKRIDEVVSIVGMQQRIQDRVKTYSLGMRQRLGIAQALLGSPKLLILDEPTNGLDPQGIKEMRQFIRELAESGISVFVSSHLLSEIQLMCDRVGIISKGSVIAVGEVEQLVQQSTQKVVWQATPFAEAAKVLSEYRVEANSDDLDDSPSHQTRSIITQMSKDQVPVVNRQLIQAGVNVYSVQLINPTLEDLFLQLTEGEQIG